MSRTSLINLSAKVMKECAMQICTCSLYFIPFNCFDPCRICEYVHALELCKHVSGA